MSRESLEYLTDDLLEEGGVRHGFFTRRGGVSKGIFASLNAGLGSGDDRAAVAENRRRIADVLRVTPESIVTAYQVHSPRVLVVDRPPAPGVRPRVDGFVTGTPGLALAVLTADCGPVLFADPEARVIGCAHAGWRGALAGVLEATLAAMETLGARRTAIRAVAGPMISADAYEVGPEFVERFQRASPENRRFFRPAGREGHARFDLPGYILARLNAAGVARVERFDMCTYGDEERFFSYRRAVHRGEPDYGRLISAIALADGQGDH